MNAVRNGERGAVLLQAILFLSLLTTAVAVVATAYVAGARTARIEHHRAQAFYAAEAGVALALADLAEHPAWSYEREQAIGDALFSVVASRSLLGETAIRSVGRMGGVASTVTATASGEGETLALVRWGTELGGAAPTELLVQRGNERPGDL